jgi:RNA-directed DNA polymerase
MASVRRFLERRLRLRVNQQKSAVAPVGERKFLGYRLDADGTLVIAPKSLARAKSLPQRRLGIACVRSPNATGPSAWGR